MTAKLAAYGLIGLLVALASAVATVAAGVALLAVKGLPVWSADVPPALVGGVLATAGYAVFGVALAVLVRSQVAAVFLAAMIFTYGDYFLGWLTPGVYPWLPTGGRQGRRLAADRDGDVTARVGRGGGVRRVCGGHRGDRPARHASPRHHLIRRTTRPIFLRESAGSRAWVRARMECGEGPGTEEHGCLLLT
ncbi:hypothetical protein [Nonomuraea salmonea]|uniref:hypothetical protein n=1 Tax=Nonomuraea salmonea TaxID=46181 RepID=UPI0031EFC1A5